MSVTIRNRRRVSLLASSSLVAASLLAGVVGLTSLAPSVAMAADECGNPSANAGAPDTLTCAGAYVTIDYTATTNGNLTLNMQDGVTVIGGLYATGNAGENITVRATTTAPGLGDPTIGNATGYAIQLQGNGPSVIVDLRTSDPGVDVAPQIGGLRGIFADNNAGNVTIRMNEGAIGASGGFGINAVATGGDVLINLTNGTTVSANSTAIRALSDGVVNITTTGLISSNQTGIFASGAGGVFIETGTVSGLGPAGIQAQSSGGPAVVTTNGAVSGGVGIIANAGGGGASVVTLGGNVTGLTGSGVVMDVNAGSLLLVSNGNTITGATNGVTVTASGVSLVDVIAADVTANGGNGIDVTATHPNAAVFASSTGLITATGDGVNIDAVGEATATVNDVTAGGAGVVVDSAQNDATINVNGNVTGGGGVSATAGGAGDAIINLLAGSTTAGTDGFSYGAVAEATGTGAATIDVTGNVTDGGIGGFANGGAVTITGAGNVAMLGAFDAVEAITTTGDITIDLTGNVNAVTADGIDTFSGSGNTLITVGGIVSGGQDGIDAISGSGAVVVTVNGTVSGGTGDGVTATTGGVGFVLVNAGGAVTGVNGVNVSTSGADNATAVVNAGGSAGSTGGGYGVQVNTSGSGTALAIIGGTVTDGGVGAFAIGTGSAFIVGGAGASITDTSGFPAIEAFAVDGAVVIDNQATVNSAGAGIDAESFGTGTVTVVNGGAITAIDEGIFAATGGGGAVVVSNTGAIGGTAASGIVATVTGGGNLTIVNTGAIGTVGNPTSDHGILGALSGGAGDLIIVATGDTYTDGAGAFGAGVAGVHGGTAGTVNVSFDGVMVSGTTGVAGAIFGAGNADGVTVTVGDGSTITAGTEGTVAVNFGLGTATTVIGNDVTIDPDDYGSQTVSAANDATVTIGDNAVIVITNTDGDDIAYGVYAESGQAADDGLGDESTEITVGANASVTIDDGAGGDADGAGGIIGVATGAAGSTAITVGNGLNLTITGNNAVGVGSTSIGGDITIATGTGTIDILGLDSVDLTGNFPGSAGIGGISDTGSISITSATGISVNNGTLDAAGIFAETGGAGSVTVVSTGQILSSGSGIAAEAVDGSIVVNSGAFIGAFGGNGINAVNTGTGDTSVFSTASITSVLGNGVNAINSGTDGFVLVVTGGGTITAGFDGIAAIASDAANTQIVQVNNSDAINANTTGGVGYGIFGVQAGSGSLVITNSGAIGGDAFSGIVGVDLNAAGQIAIVNSGAIGTAGNAVTENGIGAQASAGAAINIQSNAGAIFAGVSGIRADSTSTGNVQVFTAAASPITVTGTTGAGIWANTAGGFVEVASNSAIVSAGAGIIAANTTGNVTVGTSASVAATGGNGIQTSTGGTGVSALTIGGDVSASADGVAAISAATTGTGAITVAIGNGRTISAVSGSAIRTASGGGAVTIGTGTTTAVTGEGADATSWVVDLNNAAGGLTTFNIGAGSVVRSGDLTTAGYNDFAIRGVGGSVVINNAGRINGVVDFSALTGNVVFNNSSVTSWHTTGTSTFSAGADVLNNTGAIFTNAGGVATTFAFGAGADTFTNSGLLVVGEPTLAASTLTITGLETWGNSGRIVFGSSGTGLTAVSDGQINDRILASGTTFTGSGGSLLSMDANLGATVQTSCAVLTAADCLSLTGGSTAGSTSILVNDASGTAFGAFNPDGIVLVDVAGAGTTAASHFSLNAASDFWRADLNSADGVLDKGLFFYDLTLNGNKQHVLVGLPDSEAFEFTTFGAALSSIWQTTTGVWFERQADLRDQLDSSDGGGAGVWMKVVGSTAKRDRIQGYELFGVNYAFDTSYDQDTVALIGGLDFTGGGSAGSWVLGGQIGYVDSDITYDNSSTLTSFEGMTLGVYGSYVTGAFFVDGIVNANMLDYDHQAITLAPVGSNVFTGSVDTLGFQVEGGWTVPLGANGFFEPLASVSYASTDVDAISVPGADIAFDDITSLRASLGGRIGINADHGTFSTKWALTARYWNEFEGENTVSFDTGPGFDLTDDFSGGFGEVAGTVNIFSGDDRFSAFVNVGTKFQDDYQSVDGSLGVRWRW